MSLLFLPDCAGYGEWSIPGLCEIDAAACLRSRKCKEPHLRRRVGMFRLLQTELGILGIVLHERTLQSKPL